MSRKDVTDAVNATATPIVRDSHGNNDNQQAVKDHKSKAGSPLPRPPRRKRRVKADRGLPPDNELAKLATAFLERQRKHWPGLASAGLLPEPQSEVVLQMVEDFKERHRTGKVDVETVLPFLIAGVKLGGGYSRYSCHNSSPNSVVDQMVNELDKAHAEQRFIPWKYVFADFSVTGLDSTRQGYSSYKAILADKSNLIDTTYIDDFTRASRDELEWWKLAALSKRLNKRMIGASDGFDVNSLDWDVKITIYGLVSRLFIKGLREKSKRGMRGGARRGTCLGKLSLGFTRCECRNSDGHVVLGPDGLSTYEPCIDPTTSEFRFLLYELFVEKNWTAYSIMREFNRLEVDGWSGWSERAIKQLLANPTSIGVFIWNRTRREYDYEAGKWTIIKNPRSQWEVHYKPELAIVPLAWWRAAKRKLAAIRRASHLTGKKLSRNQASSSTLFSGTLFCADCQTELKLVRSSAKQKQLGCLDGAHGAHNCTLTTSKSTRLIEDSLLGYLRDRILTEARIESLIAMANEFVEQEALKPPIEVAPLKAKTRQLDTKINNLVIRVEDEPDKTLCDGYHKRIKELQREKNDVLVKLRDAEKQNRKSAAPLSKDAALAYLEDIRKLFNQEIPVAAEAVRQLTGPIMIKQEPSPDRKTGARWVATFTPDLMRLLDRVAANNPGIASLKASSVILEEVAVGIDSIVEYEQFAPRVKQLRADGASVFAIGSLLGLSGDAVKAIFTFIDTGERPKRNITYWAGKGRTGKLKHQEIAEEVVRLRDQEMMSFPSIEKQLKASPGTVRRAYDFARPEAVLAALEGGKRPRRGRYSKLGEAKHQEIRDLLNKGVSPKAITEATGCSTTTVHRIRHQIQAEGRDAEST